jgi:hypothetical protein
MEADFARWYLWARWMQEMHPNNPDTALLVQLLRQVDDLEHHHRANPETTASNLAVSVGDSVIQVLRRVLAAHPESSPPR